MNEVEFYEKVWDIDSKISSNISLNDDDINFVKRYLNAMQRFGDTPERIARRVLAVNDKEFTKEFLSQPILSERERVALISDTKDESYILDCFNNLNFSSMARCQLIESLREIDGMSREIYLDYVSDVLYRVPDLNNKDLITLVYTAKNFKPEEKVLETGKVPQYTLVVYDFLNRKSGGFISPDEISELIASTEDVSFIKTIIADKYKDIILPTDQKIALLGNTRNTELIEEFLKKDEKFFKTHFQNCDNPRAELIDELVMGQVIFSEEFEDLEEKEIDAKKLEIWRKYIENDEFRLSESDKVTAILRYLKNNDYAKFAIENSILKSEDYVTFLLRELNDGEYARRYVETNGDEMLLRNLAQLVGEFGTESEKMEWLSHVTEIDNVSDLSTNDLKNNPNIWIVQFTNVDGDGNTNSLYDRETYIKILEQIEKITEGIPNATKGNAESELETFKAVYKTLAKHMAYDAEALTEEKKYDARRQLDTRNLEGGLLNNLCVCSGYADILRNTLLYKGVEAKFIKGVRSNGVGHAWNQVKIGERWFNVDLTWDRNTVVELDDVPIDVLKTDKEFEDHNEYNIERTTTEMSCETGIKSLMNATRKLNQTVNLEETIEKLGIQNEIRKTEITQAVKKIKEIEVGQANNKTLHRTDEFSK